MRQFLSPKINKSRNDVKGYACPELCTYLCSSTCVGTCAGWCDGQCNDNCETTCGKYAMFT